MNNENPSKISKIFQKLDELKQPKKSNLVAHNPSQIVNKIQRKKTITINLPEKQKENTNFSSNNINKNNNNYLNYNNNFLNQNKDDSDSELLTINAAANNVKNLLSGFLENAYEDDKKAFNIKEKLKTIKKTKFNDKLNIYSIIGKEGEDSDDSNKELLNNKKSKFKRVMTSKSKFNLLNKNFNKKRRSENLLLENHYLKFKSKKSLKPSYEENNLNKKRKSDNIDFIKKRFTLKADSNKFKNRKSFNIENEKKKSINSIMLDYEEKKQRKSLYDFFDKRSSKKSSSKRSSKFDFDIFDIRSRKSLKIQNDNITNMLKKHSILLSLEDDDNIIKKTKTSNLKKNFK